MGSSGCAAGRLLVEKVWSLPITPGRSALSNDRALLLSRTEELKAHRRAQAEQRLKLGSLWEALDLVFCSETGSPLQIPNITYRYFRPILEKAELPRIRLYDLRHSCATLLLMADEHPKVVSERIGHSTIELTLDTYSHEYTTMQQQATAKL